MAFYPDKLQEAIRSRGLTLSQAAKIGGMSESRLSQAFSKNRVPTAKQIEQLSDGLSVPTYAFFYRNFQMPTEELVDFRTKDSQPFKSGLNTKRIQQYKSIRNFISELSARLRIDGSGILLEIDQNENPEQIASAVRQQLRISQIQAESKNKKDFLKLLRISIGKLGIVVIQDHHLSLTIDGLALRDERGLAHTIVINSLSRNAGARVFTLAHELCHILSKRSAVSDNYHRSNSIEKFCNDFASSLLLPRAEFFDFCRVKRLDFSEYSAAVRSATRLSEHFYTSISACLIRSFALNIAPTNYYERFAKTAFSAGHPDAEKPIQMGGPEDGPAPGVIDRAFLGDRAVGIIDRALREKLTTDVEVFQNTGLSRKRIRGLQTVASKEGIAV